MCNQKPTFRFEIDDFSVKEDLILSETFVSDGCDWYLGVYPKGDITVEDQYLSLVLFVGNRISLGTGWNRWTRSAQFYFVLLNESDKELYRSPVAREMFCAVSPSWSFCKTLPLSKFQESDFLENDKLIIEVHIEDVESFDGEYEDEDVSEEKTYINGFQIFASQATSVRKIFADHPDITKDFKPKNDAVKTVYLSVLLDLINEVENPLKSLTETELREARCLLSELTGVGFKLDWLKLKLEDVSEEETMDISGFQAFASQVTSLKKTILEHVAKTEPVLSNVCSKLRELAELGSNMDWLKSKLDEVSLKMKKADHDVSRVQQLEERVKNLEQMQSLFERDFLNSKLQESLEKKKLFDADRSPGVKKLEKRVKNLELMELGLKLDRLKSKLDEVSLERKKSDNAHESQFQQHEERIENLELLMSELKVELDLEKAKSNFSDEFFLVDEVA